MSSTEAPYFLQNKNENENKNKSIIPTSKAEENYAPDWTRHSWIEKISILEAKIETKDPGIKWKEDRKSWNES